MGKKMVACLNSTVNKKFFLPGPDHEHANDLVLFTDASFAPTAAQSYSGAVVFWRGHPILWKASKQSLTAT